MEMMVFPNQLSEDRSKGRWRSGAITQILSSVRFMRENQIFGLNLQLVNMATRHLLNVLGMV